MALFMNNSEIMGELSSDYRDHSVRRCLSQLAEGLVEKTGFKRNTRYLATEGEIIEPVVSGFREKNMEAISYVRQPIFQRQPVTYMV